MTEMKGSASTSTDIHSIHKEWDDTSCPICMDHPHNAVLLLCSSHDKGCRSYICDTSYRHSNCLDRFKKLKADCRETVPQPSPSIIENPDNERLGQRVSHDPMFEDYYSEENNHRTPLDIFETLVEENNNNHEPDRHLEVSGGGNTAESNLLKCPLCRGNVLGWMIVKEARQYLDLKLRSCSRESCSFSGNYSELRRHARRVHPATRPADVDPSRQRAWRRLEHQREYGDIVSAIRSAMPGAIVLGDYVIDNGDGLSRNHERFGPGEGGSGPWWTTFFLFQMISSPGGSLDEPRGSSRAWRTHRRSSGGHRNLWGENLLGLQNDRDEANLDDEDVPIPRRQRRRFMRSRPDEEQP